MTNLTLEKKSLNGLLIICQTKTYAQDGYVYFVHHDKVSFIFSGTSRTFAPHARIQKGAGSLIVYVRQVPLSFPKQQRRMGVTVQQITPGNGIRQQFFQLIV